MPSLKNKLNMKKITFYIIILFFSINQLQAQIPCTEVAEAILWLLSKKASFVTGSFTDLCGGV